MENLELDYNERESLVNRILAGCIPVSTDEGMLFVYEPTPLDKIIAEEVYKRELRNAELQDVWSKEEMFKFYRERGLWTDAIQKEFDEIPKLLERLKIELYEAYFQFRKRDGIKNMVAKTTERQSILSYTADEWIGTTTEGYAASCKLKYLVCSATKTYSGEKYFKNDYEKYKQEEIDNVVEQYCRSRLSEKTIRLLARTEPWRSMYGAGKIQGGVRLNDFSCLSYEQRLLLLWSKLYDSIHDRGNECPPDAVINDDDCLDGWMLVEARKAENARNENAGYKPGDKFSKADEVFIMVENIEDVHRVNAMNSPAAIIRKQQKMNAINRAGGKIEEQNTPEAQQILRAKALELQRKNR